MNIWRSLEWQYKNTALLILGLVIFFLFIQSSSVFQAAISEIGALGYFGAFVTGVFFVSIFTVAPSIVVIFDLAKELNPYLVAIFSGAGAVLGDYLIFRYLRDKVFVEIAPIFQKYSGSLWKKLFASPYFSWLIPIFGAFIIASPLPDEVGITLLGLSKIKTWQFIFVTFLLNSAGILLVILFSRGL